MNKSNVIELAGRVESTDPLTELLRSGARQLLQEAIEELLSKVVFKHLSQAATWFDSVTSIPSLNFTPLMTLPR